MRIATVDWKEAGSEVLSWLERIGGAKAKRALAPARTPELDERPTDEALELFGQLLGRAGLALISHDVDADDYRLSIVPAARVPTLTGVTHWTGQNLTKLEAKRHRAAARNVPTNPWKALAAERDHMPGSAVERVLWDLRGDRTGELHAQVAAAVPFIPAKDRPLVELTLALSGSAAKVAKSTPDPALCVRALKFSRVTDLSARLAAVSVLAERLRVTPDRKAPHQALGHALNLGDDSKAVDAALAKLSAKDRARLARLADGMLGRKRDSHLQMAVWMLKAVGDADSLPALVALDAREREISAARAAKDTSWSPEPWGRESDVPGAIARVRRRLTRR